MHVQEDITDYFSETESDYQPAEIFIFTQTQERSFSE